MKIVVLNGNPDASNKTFDMFVDELEGALKAEDNIINKFQLRSMNINHCTGCFACLVKTPGLCSVIDEMPKIVDKYINSDVVVCASPIKIGFVSALLKRTMDRLMLLFLSNLKLYNNLIYHELRYNRYPAVILLLERNKDFDVTDHGIIEDIYKRMNLNFQFIKYIDQPLGELVDEINSF